MFPSVLWFWRTFIRPLRNSSALSTRRRACRSCLSYPQSAVQDGENDAVQDENPIQDVTHAHVSEGLCTQKTHHLHQTSPSQLLRTETLSRLSAVSSTHTTVPSAIEISPQELKELTFTSPHLRRWDWSSERRRGPRAAASYRAGFRIDQGCALLLLTVRFLQKPREESSVSSSDRKSGALCPFFF